MFRVFYFFYIGVCVFTVFRGRSTLVFGKFVVCRFCGNRNKYLSFKFWED